jgi:flagellar assembly factor FliW
VSVRRFLGGDHIFLRGGDVVLRELSTARFGELSVSEEDIFLFPRGIPAFESHREWILLGEDDNPVKWLQSMTDGEVALPVCPPGFVLSKYEARIPDEDLEELEAEKPQDYSIFLVLSIPPSAPREMTANLRAPVVINHVRRLGVQAITLNEEYDLRYRIFGEVREAGPEAGAGEERPASGAPSGVPALEAPGKGDSTCSS